MISREVCAKVHREHRRALAILRSAHAAAESEAATCTAAHLRRLSETLSAHLSLVEYVIDSVAADEIESLAKGGTDPLSDGEKVSRRR